tara:strand:+ start:530 stop:730 length:201 start_codon:yes stop_codon:yes gene_type:complete
MASVLVNGEYPATLYQNGGPWVPGAPTLAPGVMALMKATATPTTGSAHISLSWTITQIPPRMHCLV